MAIQTFLFCITSIPVFQEFLLGNTYMSSTSDERIYIDLRDSLGYTNKIERRSRNNFKLKLTIETKILLMKKNEA